MKGLETKPPSSWNLSSGGFPTKGTLATASYSPGMQAGSAGLWPELNAASQRPDDATYAVIQITAVNAVAIYGVAYNLASDGKAPPGKLWISWIDLA